MTENDPAQVASLAMAMPDAQSAIRSFMNNAPPMPQTIGSDEHKAFLAGKDAVMALALTALRADNRGGALKHLKSADMLAIGDVLVAVDQALSASVGVDMRGDPLRQGRPS